ncbi:MAG: hypothetical protein ACYC1S_03675 [Gemmatimonadaceae bacterium]
MPQILKPARLSLDPDPVTLERATADRSWAPQHAAGRPRRRSARARAGAWVLLGCTALSTAGAQGQYANPDAGRPLPIEDAYAIERYALDLHLAPLGAEWGRGRRATWGLSPEATYGLLPRTQVALALPVASRRGNGDRVELEGVNLSALHTFNVETAGMPALGLRASALIPVGGAGPDRLESTLRAIATRSLPWARVHVNAAYTFGTDSGAGEFRRLASGDALGSRWQWGVALDRALPLHATLLGLSASVAEPPGRRGSRELTVMGGARVQAAPQWTLEASLGRRLTGPAPAWLASVGIARIVSVNIPRPGVGRWGS